MRAETTHSELLKQKLKQYFFSKTSLVFAALKAESNQKLNLKALLYLLHR